MADKKYKYTKVGAVLKSKNGGSPYLVLGNEKANSPKYNYTVEMIVRDGEGNVVSSVKNPLLSTLDPRKRPGISEEEAGKISSSLISEVFISEKL